MEIYALILCLVTAIIGLIWICRKSQSFAQEEKQYKERQAIMVAIIKAGLEEAKWP